MPVPTRSAKFTEWLPYWLEQLHQAEPQADDSKYAMHVRLYLVPLLGSSSLEALGRRHVRTFVADMSPSASPATAKEAHRVLRTALTAACREDRSSASPTPPAFGASVCTTPGTAAPRSSPRPVSRPAS